ncbi:hypothetical protein [Frondihabitans australicus]|uniref:Tfp pilus assembly protein PilN n=1 Tax=Frondihabitans australicus TaxID=386892 RepID=A0A495IHN3_9MICO|nr:hypothetical protein [Frondihabitans australicus]RKR75522.1 hypothetical protein C8E83_2670 [Frondihabitans australicus]
MKFYLTKAAQRAAESGQAPVAKEKVAKAPRVKAEKTPRLKAEKAPRVKADKAPSARQQRKAAASAAPAQAPALAPGFGAPAASSVIVPTSPALSAPVAVPLAPAASVAAPLAPAESVAAPLATTATSVLDAPAPPAEQRTGSGRAARAPKAAAAPREKKGVIAIGGQPRVDLLPQEVRIERKAANNVRRAWLGVGVVVVIVALAIGGATVYSQGAANALTTAQASTTRLNLEAQKYSQAQTVQDQVDLVQASLKVGGSTDIDWPGYLAAVALTVPSGAQLSGVNVDSASSVQAYAQASSPLEGQRVATLTLTATSTSLPSVPTWLENLTKIKGYEDATAGTVALSDGVYTSTVTLHINKKAFSNAYTKGS